MAGLKVSWASILIIMIIMSGGEARRLMVMEETRTTGEACAGGCRPSVQGRAGLAVTTTKMATIDSRPTPPGHSPGIGNKIAGNTR
ncbi:hypothetical protein GQ55_2G282600 [Panicum hallii var. hallii]|uniref:Uncharacterized protein n=1 Tax=Panicum hallii var. hallii TaxID=1504633 RepID=A0A2T7ET82_9POAL|nr:hypothetical protein GQ55_2G282600 [Panicum hallii var. hallii]